MSQTNWFCYVWSRFDDICVKVGFQILKEISRDLQYERRYIIQLIIVQIKLSGFIDLSPPLKWLRATWKNEENLQFMLFYFLIKINFKFIRSYAMHDQSQLINACGIIRRNITLNYLQKFVQLLSTVHYANVSITKPSKRNLQALSINWNTEVS